MAVQEKNKPKIKITVGRYSGFCFGVKRAYNIACTNLKNNKNIFILGKLVHNSDVCRELKNRGIEEIKSIINIQSGAVIFTAHGVGPGLYEKAKAQGLEIIDTTCPKVIKVQRLAKNYAEKGWQVIIFGDKQHKEVKGIKEWSNKKGIIIGSLKEAKKIKIDKMKKNCFIAQTTQNVREFNEIKKYFSKQLPIFTYFNTICNSTADRQNEVRKIASNSDAVIVVGGRDSANSKRLWEIAKEINSKSYFIENEKGLRKEWVKDLKNIAISAGASTPEWVIKKVVDKIKKIA
jgi:(E)-4-hydroxy-3-methyl-but-2-enyl pyrophosphate reductase